MKPGQRPGKTRVESVNPIDTAFEHDITDNQGPRWSISLAVHARHQIPVPQNKKIKIAYFRFAFGIQQSS